MKKSKKILYNIKNLKLLLDKKALQYLFISCFFLTVLSILAPFSSFFYKIILDSLSRDFSFIVLLVLGYILSQLGSEILQHLKDYTDQKFQYRLNNMLTRSITSKLNTIKLEELERPETYDYIDRVYAKVSGSTISFINSILGIISPIIMACTYGMLLISIKWYFPIIILLSSIPYLFVIWKELKSVYEQDVELSKKTRQVTYIISAATDRRYIKENKLFNLSNFFTEKLCSLQNEITHKKVWLLTRYIGWELIVNVLQNLSLGICLFITAYDISVGKGSIGNIALVISAIQSIMSNITSVFSGISTLNQNSLYLSDWIYLNELPDEKVSSNTKISDYNISLKDISFPYPDSATPVLKHITLDIPENCKVAIVGENGSGKSTLIQLIMGNYQATSGKIYVGEHELNDVLENFREITVPVFQNFIRYQLSLKENIQAGNLGKNVSYESLELLNFNSFINKLPRGLDTQLGQLDTTGIDLSGGEWQKIAMFRALGRENSKILIMDEPTASLDPLVENEIYKEFTRIGSGKTVILISHRLSAARLCDKIVVLKNGQIVEQGSHNELMDLCGEYYRMFSLQKHLYV